MGESDQKTYLVNLSITPDEFSKLYRGQASNVRAMASSGEVLSFPARSLQPYLSQEGVRGHFVITTDAANKLLSIVPLS